MRDGVARIGIISLLSAADTAGGGAPLGAPPGLGLRRDASAAAVAAAAATAAAEGPGAPRPRSGQTAAALELSATAYAAPLVAAAAGSQKLLLLAALLEVCGVCGVCGSVCVRGCDVCLTLCAAQFSAALRASRPCGPPVLFPPPSPPRGPVVPPSGRTKPAHPATNLLPACPPPCCCHRLATGSTRRSSCAGCALWA